MSLQIVEEQVKKALQLYETFNVRFGVMIVGGPNSGKTTCSDLLSASLTEMHKEEVNLKV